MPTASATAFAPRALGPYRLCLFGILAATVAAGVLIPVAADLKLQMKLILAVAAAGLATVVLMPKTRVALVCAWVFVLPLSLEKVFPFMSARYPGFLGTNLVISGADLVLAVLVIVLLVEAALTDGRTFAWPAPATPFALLTAWALAMFFFTSPSGSGAMQVVHFGKMLALLLAVYLAVRSREDLLMVLGVAAVAILIQSVIVILSYKLNHKIGFSSKVTSEAMMTFSGANPGESVTRATGTMGHVNQQAMFHTLITFPLIVFLMVRNWFWRSVGWVVMAASFCAILLTFSRTAWISCVVAAAILLVVAWRYGRITRGQWLSLCGGVLVAAVLACAFGPLIVNRLFTGDDGASASRIRMADLALTHITEHPLTGVGPGNFVNARLDDYPAQWARDVWLPRGKSYSPRDLAGLELYDVEIAGRWYYFPGVVHNKFLVVSAELGLVGLGIFLWFEWRVLKAAFTVLRSRDALLWWAGLGLLCSFLATQTEFMFDLFYDDKTVAVPIFVDALLLAAVRIAARADSREEAR